MKRAILLMVLRRDGRGLLRGRHEAAAPGRRRARAAEPPPDDFDGRARKVVAQMTLDEKITQLHGLTNKTNHRVVPGLPRLGIPALTVANGPAGAGPAGPGHQGKATALPAPIALAATWDVEAARTHGEIAAEEAGLLGNLLESPDINIARMPHNGRTFEGFGEDPVLAGALAVANIQGIQGRGLIANVKHYAGNNQEANRFHVNDIIDERTLRELYLPAFEASIKEGHCDSLMGAYNKVNGAHCCENDLLLNQVLKGDWGFDGFVTSDFWAVHSTVPTAKNGLDLEMPNDAFFGAALKKAVESGEVPGRCWTRSRPPLPDHDGPGRLGQAARAAPSRPGRGGRPEARGRRRRPAQERRRPAPAQGRGDRFHRPDRPLRRTRHDRRRRQLVGQPDPHRQPR